MKLQRGHENKNKQKQKRQKERNNDTKQIQKKNRRRAPDRERSVYRQPRAIRYPPGSQLSRICTERHSIYIITVLSRFQASLSSQPTPLGESFSRFNQCGFKTSQACYGHHRCNHLNLVRLFCLFFPPPVFGRLFLFLHTRDQDISIMSNALQTTSIRLTDFT